MRVGTHKNKEVEVKLRVADGAALRKRLLQLRARKYGRVHEMNILYDTPRGRFLKRGNLLRLRLEAPPNSAKAESRAVLTYKGPSLGLHEAEAPAEETGAARHQPDPGQRYKVREEMEVGVAEPKQLRAIFKAVGLVPAFRYEKFRTTYALPGAPGVTLELDETPIGVFVELEGPPRAIDRAARLLGYHPADYIIWSYRGLYLDHCRRRGVPAGDMVFARRRAIHRKLPKK